MKHLIVITLTFSLIACDSSTTETNSAKTGTNETGTTETSSSQTSTTKTTTDATQVNMQHAAKTPPTMVRQSVAAQRSGNGLVKDELKLQTVRGMYAGFQTSNDLPKIFSKYGENGLKSASELAVLKASTPEQMYDQGISECDEAGWELSLLPTQDLEVQDIIDINYKVLANGNVSASLITDPYDKDVDSNGFEVYKDYAFDCDTSDCKVTDVLSHDGISSKSEVIKYCSA